MSFFKVATLAVAIMFSCCPVSEGWTEDWADYYKKCETKCKEADWGMSLMGNSTCVMRKVDGKPIPMSTCGIECKGEQPAEDQNKCFCDLCKRFEYGAMWCTAPFQGGINVPEDCDTLVAAGKAKLYDPKVCMKNPRPRY